MTCTVRVLLQGCDLNPAIAFRPLVCRRQSSLICRYKKITLSKLHVYRAHVTNLLTNCLSRHEICIWYIVEQAICRYIRQFVCEGANKGGKIDMK
jgi:hypothetical protein